MPKQDPNADSAEDSIPDAGEDDSEPGEWQDTSASVADDEETGTSPSGTSDDLQFEEDTLGETLRTADEGNVEFYNQYEAELSGMEPEEVKGKNFFTQVAPCTNNRLFRGRFKRGVQQDELDETFTYTYTYRMRPTLVEVRLYRDDSGRNWIIVQKY